MAAAATILTKYNIGLPLVPAALCAAVVTRDRRLIVGTGLAVTFALVSWVGFLTWQEDGWASFLRFAENRSNSVGQSAWERLGWYAMAYEDLFVGARALAIVIAGFALIGGSASIVGQRPWRRAVHRPRLVLVLVYVFGSLLALANHEYLLARNLVGPVLALFFAAGIVVRDLPRLRRRIGIAVVVVLGGIGLVENDAPSAASVVDRYYPKRNAVLRDLSDEMVERFGRAQRIRVVGAFNEFSPGWIRILRSRHAPGTAIGVDAPYPLERDRAALSDAWSESYPPIVERWHSEGVELILGIRIDEGTVFETTDHRRWNRWKRNLLRAADDSALYRLDETIALRGDVVLEVYSAVELPASTEHR